MVPKLTIIYFIALPIEKYTHHYYPKIEGGIAIVFWAASKETAQKQNESIIPRNWLVHSIYINNRVGTQTVCIKNDSAIDT